MNAEELVAVRRIALLVTRASEDCVGAQCEELRRISAVIDEMKRGIVLGRSLDAERSTLSALIRRLPKAAARTSAGARVSAAVLDELCALA